MTIRIGIIGCGGIAEYHVHGYLKVPEARVTAICDVEAARAEQLAVDVDGVRIYRDFHDLAVDDTVDAVDICLPHHLHKDAVVAAAAAGKHILCEKPLCLSMDEAYMISRTVAENGVTLMCAHNLLFDPAIRRAKQMLADGALGRIYQLHTTDAFRLSPDQTGMNWRSKKETMGGGELIDTGYHPTYMLLYLACSDPIEVTAMLGRYYLQTLEGEDTAQVLIRFADGSVGHITTSWAFSPPERTWPFAVIGERGYLYGGGSHLSYKLDDGDLTTLTLPAVDTYDAEIADFVACLRDKRRPMQTEAEGSRVLQVILGAYRSEQEKCTVDLTRDDR